jgi:hypothetical protein
MTERNMELNDENIRTAIGLKEDLEYMIDRFKTDGLGYVNLENLEKALEEVKKDIAEFQKKQATSCPALKIGAIIRINGGDGISYSQRDYYKVSKISDTHIYFDQVTVVRGDYGNEIKVNQGTREGKEDWIKRYNRHYHKDNITLEEWDELLGYAEKIPWPKEE